MISYVEDSSDLPQALALWNKEVGSVYPIPQKAFATSVLAYPLKKTLFAFDGAELVGFIICKWTESEENIIHVSLFYVKKQYRRQGIGSHLFAFLPSTSAKIVIGKDPDNFFPGVSCDFDNLTDVWLLKRGFAGTRYTHDLIARNPISFPLTNADIEYCKCGKKDKDALLSFISANGWKRWEKECASYFAKRPDDEFSYYIIGKRKAKIVSFVRINTCFDPYVSYNVMWQERFSCLGGIGPLGVDSSLRRQKLGSDMMSVAIRRLQAMGIREIMIDWTGLMEIYRPFGFEVWKSYKYMDKSF